MISSNDFGQVTKNLKVGYDDFESEGGILIHGYGDDSGYGGYS